MKAPRVVAVLQVPWMAEALAPAHQREAAKLAWQTYPRALSGEDLAVEEEVPMACGSRPNPAEVVAVVALPRDEMPKERMANLVEPIRQERVQLAAVGGRQQLEGERGEQ